MFFIFNFYYSLTYDILCGTQEITGTVVQKLDTTKYPVFRIQKIILPSQDYLVKETAVCVMQKLACLGEQN